MESITVTYDAGKRIKALRKDWGLTLKELGERSGVDTGNLSKIEREVITPSVSTLSRIADALGVTLSILLGESPNTIPSYFDTDLHAHLLKHAMMAVTIPAALGKNVADVATEYLKAMFDVGIREARATLEASPKAGSDE